MSDGLNSRIFSILSYLLLLATAAAGIYMAVTGQMMAAATLGGFVLAALVFIAMSDTLPRIFTFLFVVAGVINAAGYVFHLWKTPVWFDETVHFYSSFTVMAAIGWVAFSRTSMNAEGHTMRFVGAIAGLGIVLGLLWEVFEWAIGIIGSPTDTIIDVIMDTLGAIAAGLFCAWAAETERAAAN